MSTNRQIIDGTNGISNYICLHFMYFSTMLIELYNVSERL